MAAATTKPKTRKPPPPQEGGGPQLFLWEESAAAPHPGLAPPPAAPKVRRRAPLAPVTTPLDLNASTAVGEEILSGRYHPGIWALALARSQGGSDQAVAEYARLRLGSMQEDLDLARQKALALEARRLSGFKKIQPPDAAPECAPVAAARPRCNRRRSHPLPVVPLLALWIGTSGVLAAGSRLLRERLDFSLLPSGLLGQLALGALLVGTLCGAHQFWPAGRRILRELVPVCAAGAAACSMILGTLIFRDAASTGGGPTAAAASPAAGPPAAPPPQAPFSLTKECPPAAAVQSTAATP